MILIVRIILGIFRQTGRTWNIGGKPVQPSEDDVRKVLDQAAKTLYSRDVGGFTMGGLHVERNDANPKEFDVYVHVGTYN
jgi:hypothetical protein